MPSACRWRMDVLPLTLRDIGQKLEHNVSDQRPGQVPVDTGVQQGHIQHTDVGPFLFGDDAPLLQDLFIIASQPVDAFDDQKVARFQFFQQLLV